MVATHSPSSTLRPRNRSLANANPASVQNATVPRVIGSGDDQRVDQPVVERRQLEAFSRLSKSCALGSRGGVSAAISALVCEAITIV